MELPQQNLILIRQAFYCIGKFKIFLRLVTEYTLFHASGLVRGIFARHHMIQIPDQLSDSKSKFLLVQYHVRGRRKRQPLTTQCQTVHDIIDLGQRSFPEFAERNPWICIDSKHGTVFVGLDPERQVPKCNGAPGVLQRNVSLAKESIEQ
jgi:hypothetical protein